MKDVIDRHGSDRYLHGVVDVCMRLHGCDTGSGDGIDNDEREELVEWLRWRISIKAWTETKRIRGVDCAVKLLALMVLEQADNVGKEQRIYTDEFPPFKIVRK